MRALQTAYPNVAEDSDEEPETVPRRAPVAAAPPPPLSMPESASSAGIAAVRVPDATAWPRAADASKHHIPSGYYLATWDPSETPIKLLRNVFDGSSLGKFIYDCTVFRHGARSPMARLAGDLWLLLIRLMGEIKLFDEAVPKIPRRQRDDRDTMEDCIGRGEQLVRKLRRLLRRCEVPMKGVLPLAPPKLLRPSRRNSCRHALRARRRAGAHRAVQAGSAPLALPVRRALRRDRGGSGRRMMRDQGGAHADAFGV